MTDKQIMIDGVDVAGCEHRSNTHKELLAGGAIKEFSNYCYISNDGCYGINCYYKQLKRLEKEVKHWQTEHREAKAKGEWTYDLVRKRADRLKQENERLKKQYNCYACDSCGGKEDYINMKRHTENAIKTVHKYRQALQEIKKYIAKICKEECGYVQKKRCPDSDCRFGAILDLITKAEEENE